jgi:DNA replication protein DnaC
MRRLDDILGSLGLPDSEPERASTGVASGSAADPCPICKGKGWILLDVPPGDADFNRPIPCRCTEARMTTERLRELRKLSNLGALERMTFDSFMPNLGVSEVVRFNLYEAFDRCRSYANNPSGWLVLLGGYGSGKTHLAAAIANQALALGRQVLFIVVPDLLDYLRSAYSPNSDAGLDARMEAIREAPLLILDDLGAHHSTPWAQEKLFQIINHRYNSRLPTVITSNQQPEEMDPRITSRLVDPDLSQVYELMAPDFRQSGAGLDRSATGLSTLRFYGEQTFGHFNLREGLPAAERENLQRALATARAYAESPSGWLVLTGVYGCGKTHLAAAIANHQITAARTISHSIPLFVVVPDLLDHLRATFSPTSTTTLDRLFEQVKNASLLVLDDLGTESATPWAKEKLFQLLNHRYVARLPTVITISDLKNADERIISRLNDTSRCTVFRIEAPSYRGDEARTAVRATKTGTRGRRASD